MPTDELKQRIQEMKRRAADAVHGEFCGVINECQAPVIVDIATRHFVAEIERLERENAQLRGVRIISDDPDKALRERAAQGPMTANEIAAFTGNTRDCAVGNLRMRKGVTVTVAGRGKQNGTRSHKLYNVNFD